MRSLSRTWPPTTDRYARMRKRAATVPNAEQLRAEFEQAWAEIVSSGPQTLRLFVLPAGSMRRPTRADRRCKRMRAHTSRTLEATKRHLNGRWQRILATRWRAGIVTPAELRAEFGPPIDPLDLAAPPEHVEVTYVGPEFPKLAMAALDERAVTDSRIAAANRLIEDHCAPNPDTDPEQDPHA